MDNHPIVREGYLGLLPKELRGLLVDFLLQSTGFYFTTKTGSCSDYYIKIFQHGKFNDKIYVTVPTKEITIQFIEAIHRGQESKLILSCDGKLLYRPHHPFFIVVKDTYYVDDYSYTLPLSTAFLDALLRVSC